MTLLSLISELKKIRPDENARLLACMICDEWGNGTPYTDCTDTRSLAIDDRRIKDLLEQYADGTPFAYLLGKAYFCKETYLTNGKVLIPRADTEVLVEYAVKNLPRGAVFADLGTGTGCIAVSILRARPDCTAYACDIDPDNAALAEKNAELNGVADRMCTECRDMLSFLPSRPLDAVFSNPPYIKHDVLPTLSDYVRHEPALALDGGVDGLDFYRVLVKKTPLYIKKDGFCVFEIGYDQANDLQALALDAALSCRIIRDYGGRDRAAVIRRT